MNWLKKVFGLNRESVPLPSHSYNYNDNILAPGCWFRATVSLNTPLAVLQRHGEHFSGLPSTAPVIAGGQHGTWVMRTKTWCELGIETPEFTGTLASPIGPVTPDEVIPFLIAFRQIVEADLDHRTQLAMLLELGKNVAHGPYWRRFCQSHQDLPYSYFYLPLTQLPGVGRKTAKSLYDAGIRRCEDISTASLAAQRSTGGWQGKGRETTAGLPNLA